ncbi:DJ-1/PfpI family protein [Streptomyces sp. NPDC002574]|uniref:DJ-1/PfpI family protein n=1 Tax=Streptomyces sp. NPDC002574 TaxID=3364652 RepID=UPI00369CAC71
MHAQFVLFDGFDPLDVLAPYETLGAGGVEVSLVCAEGPRDVPSGLRGVSLRAEAVLDPARADLVVVPGAAGRVLAGEEDDDADDTVPARLARTLGTSLPGLLKAAMDRPGTIVAAVCGGSHVLAGAGLIGGRHATTHVLGLDALWNAGVKVVDARVVDDGDLVTAAGVTSGLDLGLYLLERELGPRVAHAVERLLAHERRGVVWRDAGLVPAGARGRRP